MKIAHRFFEPKAAKDLKPMQEDAPAGLGGAPGPQTQKEALGSPAKM